MAGYLLILASLAVAVAGIPLDDHVLYKLDPVRFHYVEDANGKPFLADLWVKASDLQESARYTASSDNVYHLFTTTNPSVSQPIVLNNVDGLLETNYDASKRTIVLIHGWNNDATSDVNAILVPAFLGAEDVNVIVVDWSAGASTINYIAAVSNTVTSGESVAVFMNWLVSTTGGSFDNFHFVGHSLGGHQVGVAGRNLDSAAAYITAMDPAMPGFVDNDNCFSSTDGSYTEVIHTNAGTLGYLEPLGDVDFYPNGGTDMPGCLLMTCDHSRSFYYMGESVLTAGFTGVECSSRVAASNGECDSEVTLNMGGLEPKTGRTGIFYLETNEYPPFSQD